MIDQLAIARIFHAVAVQLGVLVTVSVPPALRAIEIALALRISAATEPLVDGESSELMITWSFAYDSTRPPSTSTVRLSVEVAVPVTVCSGAVV